MQIERREGHRGVQVNLEPEECELFVQLVRDADIAESVADTFQPSHGGGVSYFSISLTIGRGIIQLLPSTR
jgi:hypothetical protein